MAETPPVYPRPLSLDPILFGDLPPDLMRFFELEIGEMNTFITHMGLTKAKNPNFISAIKKAITMQLYRVPDIDFDETSPPGFFMMPKKCYDSAYLIGCLTQHSPFLVILDDLEFPYQSWNLLNITQKVFHVLLFAKNNGTLAQLIKKIAHAKMQAKANAWAGTLKITAALVADTP